MLPRQLIRVEIRRIREQTDEMRRQLKEQRFPFRLINNAVAFVTMRVHDRRSKRFRACLRINCCGNAIGTASPLSRKALAASGAKPVAHRRSKSRLTASFLQAASRWFPRRNGRALNSRSGDKRGAKQAMSRAEDPLPTERHWETNPVRRDSRLRFAPVRRYS
jgi:hypothetical protein